MDCRAFRETILTARPADRSPSVCAQLEQHQGACPDCRAFRQREEAVASILGASRGVSAPGGFADRVMARVEAGQVPAVSSWVDWFLGPLRAPVPGFSFTHAAAIAVVVVMLATAGFFVANGGGPSADVPGTPIMAGAGMGTAPTAAPVLDQDSMDELIRRHQGSSVMQPLSDDEGMRLVSF